MQTSSIKKKYSFGIKWNTIELIVTQATYLLFQLMLQAKSSHQFFVEVNTQIALIFFITSLTSLGLSQAIFVFFNTYSKNRSSFRLFFLPQIIFQIFVTLLSVIVIGLIKNHFQSLAPMSHSFLLISTILFFESIKKIFRTTIQVFFKNNLTAIIEILTYVIFFCLFVFLNLTPVLSLTIVSVLSFIGLSIVFFHVYLTLPSQKEIYYVKLNELIKQRFWFFSYRLTYIIPSGNLIVPLLIPFFSGPTGVVIYFLKNGAGFLRAFSEKVLGINTASLIARVKDSQKKEKEEAISYSLKRIYNITNVLIISSIPLLFLFLFKNNKLDYCLSPSLYNALLIILLIELIPMLFVPQEKYLIVEKKVPYLLVFKFTNLLSIYFLVNFFKDNIIIALLLSVAIQLLILLMLNQFIEKKTNTNIIYKNVKYFITFTILVCLTVITLITYMFC